MTDATPEVEPNGDWRVYRGTGRAADPPLRALPEPPPWRRFRGTGSVTVPGEDVDETTRRIGYVDQRPRTPHRHEVEMVNAAIYLRRPLLVTGRPGTGKSSLAYLIARELGLGPVLRWPVTSRTELKTGLHHYDAIARVQEAGTLREGEERPGIGDFVHLGPLGTALLPYDLPRVLLIDELDKSDIDLPNDLLNVLEDGEYEIPELVRIARREPDVTVLTHDEGGTAEVNRGVVRCRAFPIVLITSNGEREFPPAFLRRCLKLHLEPPSPEQLASMVAAQFGEVELVDVARLIREFLRRSEAVGGLAADQLLNSVHLAVQMATSGAGSVEEDWQDVLESVWHSLSTEEP
ncbi:AAA family ATPase [Saccharopolyspora flava]|uniref:AAA domain (Dynein-related subfamily) n=1 Tax=Saccharopolyspora flava TaxID=95161 RepID=A0A1I6SL23_9PSEU|nr:MoxR family ATPase [Saccharopolyspora flava]SFS77560.1 AAA domain (dynein-related subfamily) [Saccharopolyspora flava]